MLQTLPFKPSGGKIQRRHHRRRQSRPPVKINLRCWVFEESGRIALIYIYCRAELTCSASAPALAWAFTRLATGRNRPFNGFAYPLQVSFPPFLAKHPCLLLGGKVITSHLRISSQCPYRCIRVPLDPLSSKSYRMTALRYLLLRGGLEHPDR